MNMPRLQYTTLCIFGLLNLRRTALAIHMQTCDTRILLIVLACHRTLALYINSRYNPTFSEEMPKPIQISIKVKRSWPFQAFVNLQEKERLQSIFFPPNCIIACQVAAISFLFVPSAHFDMLWETFTSAFVLWLSPSQMGEVKTH